jgi:site-specific recombinase XerC
MVEKKYQIFVSSTFGDLKNSRNKVIETILKAYHLPVGMEMFSADDADQWKVIKDTIDLSDYYVVIIGHRYGSVTSEGIRRALQTAAKNAGLSKRVTPNMLRHTFGTHALLNGGDLISVKELMGHKNILTTEKYLHSIQEYNKKTVELLDDEDEDDGFPG